MRGDLARRLGHISVSVSRVRHGVGLALRASAFQIVKPLADRCSADETEIAWRGVVMAAGIVEFHLMAVNGVTKAAAGNVALIGARALDGVSSNHITPARPARSLAAPAAACMPKRQERDMRKRLR
jgi:hypothetical protein